MNLNIKLLCKECRKKARQANASYMKGYRAKTKATLEQIKEIIKKRQ